MFFSCISGVEPVKYSMELVTAPATEPITLAEAKTQCRVDISDDDAYLTLLIQAAREYVEDCLGRRLVTQTWKMRIDQLPYPFYEIRLPYGPWQSITSLSFLDPAGTLTVQPSTLYTLDTNSFEPRLYPNFAQIWPLTQYFQNAVIIQHVSGYGAASAVPAKLKLACLMLVAHWYENREPVSLGIPPSNIPRTFESLIASERQSLI